MDEQTLPQLQTTSVGELIKTLSKHDFGTPVYLAVVNPLGVRGQRGALLPQPLLGISNDALVDGALMLIGAIEDAWLAAEKVEPVVLEAAPPKPKPKAAKKSRKIQPAI